MSQLRLQQVSKVYAGANGYHTALHPTDLTVQAGEFIAIIGPSGGGKSTLLGILGCLLRPDRGRYWVNEQLVDWRRSRQLAGLRGSVVATIFQGFELIEHWTVVENIGLGLRFHAVSSTARTQIILSAMRQVGILSLAQRYPSELSGGEQQRVAIARALCAAPQVLLADEPTGNLDPETASGILKILEGLHGRGLTLVMVTHDTSLAARAQRIVTISGGRLVKQEVGAGADVKGNRP